jgi:type I restriction enzyme, S subunit
MRTAALQMAAAGRLVPQDSSEGSGEDLLANIKLVGRRASRRGEDLTTVLPPLPPSWSTAPWSAIGYSQNGRAFPSADYTTAGTKLLRPGNLYASGKVGWTAANTRYLPERYASDFPSYLVRPGEIIMNLTAQSLKDEFLGRVCMTGTREESVLLNQRLARLTPVGMNPRFVFYVLKSPLFRRFVDQLNTGSLIQHMFTSQLDHFTFPVPPRGEQDRIVERLEEILTFFDRLEETILKIGMHVPALRSAILNTAFSGRIVPQDHTDEPASILLERIAAERAVSNGHGPMRGRKPRVLGEEVTA